MATRQHTVFALILTATLLVLTLVVPSARANRARDILDRRQALDDGPRRWDDREQRIDLEIVGSRGSARHRTLSVYERRLPDDERQTIIFFEEPSEVEGTGFLSLSHPGKAAEQWLYLPAYGRVRQITAQTRTQSFVGTDLTHQDLDILQEMPSWSEADASSELVRDDAVDDEAVHVIALTPRREDIGYDRLVLWLRAEDLVMRRLEFFDEGPDPVKRVEQRDIKMEGKIPVAHTLEIERPQRGSRTVMTVRSVTFDQKLEDDLFTQRALERGER